MNEDILTILRPDDWHLHLRSGEMLRAVLPWTSRHFGRAIVMPNLNPPVITRADAVKYHSEITAAIPPGDHFQPLMTLYLTEKSDPADLRAAFENGDAVAAKLYPAGATTNSDAGVRDLEKIYPVLEVMEEIGMPFLVHGEVVDPEVDIFDREAVFIEQKLIPIRRRFPRLKIVFEHLTTENGVDYVLASDNHTAATITPHHLVINRNAMLAGGIKPHYYCLPVAKREHHRQALLAAATGQPGRFFAGTDSAPHPRGAKESACGCAGIYSAHAAVELYATAFEQAGDFTHFETFMSTAGPAFYRLPVNTGMVTLRRENRSLPSSLPFGDGEELVPLMAGQTLHWKLEQDEQ